MALVITRRLCRTSVRSQFFNGNFNQRTAATFLPRLKMSFVENIYPVRSVPNLNLNNSYGICTMVKYYSSGASENENKNASNKPEETKLSLLQRFKQMYKDYWYVLVPVHLVTSAAWFGGFYYLACSGVDIPAALELMNFSEKIVNSMRNSSMGYVAIAYALYKIVTPLRYAVTLGGTTISIQYLKNWGYIKPIPKGKLRQFYSDTKEGFKGKKENLIESMKESVKETKQGIQEKKSNIVSTVKDTGTKAIKEKVISTNTTSSNKS